MTLTPSEALLSLLAFGPAAFYAGCVFGSRYPHVILGRNRRHVPR
jgi:hypothetical protein